MEAGIWREWKNLLPQLRSEKERERVTGYGLRLAWAEIHWDWAARGGIGAERTQQRVAGGRAVRVRESHTHT